MNNVAYEKNYYGWLMENAQFIRQDQFAKIDLVNITEELESMGKRHQQELINRLAVLIMHLLKWQFQAGKRTPSWEHTIKERLFEVLYGNVGQTASLSSAN